MFFRNLKKIIFVVLFSFIGDSYAQYVRYTEDTAKVGFGIGGKAGIIYDYPFFNNRSALSPIGELDFYVLFDKLQLNTGIGFFANNSSWYQGADQTNPERYGTTEAINLYIPLNADFRIFSIKRNLFFVKVGFNFIFSTQAKIVENSNYVTLTYNYTNVIFGLGGYVGFKYTRYIGERILLGAELDLNFALSPLPSALLGNNYSSGYNMAARHPNGDFKICFEYIFSKKHLNLLDPSKRKKKKKEDDIIDED